VLKIKANTLDLYTVVCVAARRLKHNVSGVAKGGRGAVRPWRHFYGGGTMGYAAGYKTAEAVLK